MLTHTHQPVYTGQGLVHPPLRKPLSFPAPHLKQLRPLPLPSLCAQARVRALTSTPPSWSPPRHATCRPSAATCSTPRASRRASRPVRMGSRQPYVVAVEMCFFRRFSNQASRRLLPGAHGWAGPQPTSHPPLLLTPQGGATSWPSARCSASWARTTPTPSRWGPAAGIVPHAEALVPHALAHKRPVIGLTISRDDSPD